MFLFAGGAGFGVWNPDSRFLFPEEAGFGGWNPDSRFLFAEEAGFGGAGIQIPGFYSRRRPDLGTGIQIPGFYSQRRPDLGGRNPDSVFLFAGEARVLDFLSQEILERLSVLTISAYSGARNPATLIISDYPGVRSHQTDYF